MHRILCFSLSLAGWLAAERVAAQVVVGQVFDESTNTAITAAEVLLIDRSGMTRGQSIADSAGWFRLSAPVPGAYRVRASSLGYERLESGEVNLEKGVELHLELRLSSAAVALEPIRIVGQRSYRVGRLGEYYDRATWTRKTGLGRVYMRDDIERINPFNLTTLIRMSPMRIGCPLTYLLDGLEIDAEVLDSLVRPDEVEGIEIYRGSTQIPPEYRGRGRCGLVLVWTRLDPPGLKPFTWKRLFIGAGVAVLLFGIGVQLRQD